MLSHIHHINFVVKNLDHAMTYFNQLLSQTPVIESLHERKVNTARYKIGESLLVLVQPTSEDGVVADILARKGEGIFLLSLATESIDHMLQKLDANYADKRQGLDGWSICDISPIEQFGVILQLTENLPTEPTL